MILKGMEDRCREEKYKLTGIRKCICNWLKRKVKQEINPQRTACKEGA